MTRTSIFDWDDFLSHHPNAHLLQTSAWGELKSDFGWEVERLVVEDEAGAQVLFRRLPLGYRIAYIPKGPVGETWDRLWPEVDQLCHERKVVFLKVEPDLWEKPECQGVGSQEAALPPGFRTSPNSIQPPRTLVVDISGDEERILRRMKQKTRYNIRLALKKGVVIRPCADFAHFHRMMQATGERDQFDVHSLRYYQRAYELFHPKGECEFLMAEYEGEPLAGLMVFAHGSRSWYLYGASASRHRERMPTYLLQWEAMRWARSRECSEYDLWGVPDEKESTLEGNFSGRSDGLWGVYRFKRGFGGQLCRTLGPWDRVYRPALYSFYRWWMMRRGVGA